MAGLSVAAGTTSGAGGSVSISGDIGDDKLNLSGVNVAAATNGGVASSLNVDAGAGDDKVSLSNSAADSLFATLGPAKTR